MSTEWYYAVEGASIGPVSQSEFESLVRSGTIRSDTLVWQEGMADWLPYGRARMPIHLWVRSRTVLPAM